MNSTDISKRLKPIFAQQLGIDADKIIEDEDLFTGELDSLDQVELVMAIEEEFDITIDDNKAEELRSFQDVLDYLVENI